MTTQTSMHDLWPYTAAIAGVMVVVIALVLRFYNTGTQKPAMWRYTSQYDHVKKLIAEDADAEAEALLKSLVRKSDAPGHFFHLRAIIADRAGDLPLTAKRWREFIKRFPADAFGYQGLARIMIRQGKVEEAKKLLNDARHRVTHRGGLTKVLAEIAQADKDLPLAIKLWAQVREESPGDEAGYLRGRMCLLQVGRTEEADELLADVAMRMPSNEEVMKALAKAQADAQPKS